MIDIDAEFRKAYGLSATVNVDETDPEPLTLDKLRQAAKDIGLPRSFEVNKTSDLTKRLSLRDAGSLAVGDSFNYPPTKSMHGIPVVENSLVPVDVLVIKEAGVVTRVVALTEDAHDTAQAFSSLIAQTKRDQLRSIQRRERFEPWPV